MLQLLPASNKTTSSNNTDIDDSLTKRVDDDSYPNENHHSLVSTRIVSVVEFKKILEEKCEIDYPISTPMRKRLDKRYCSKKLRQIISSCLFAKKNLRDVVWSRLRKIAIAGRTNQQSVDKSKVLSYEELSYIFFAALYIKDRNLKYVPNISQNVIDNFNAWIQLCIPKITKLEIFYTLGTESLQIEVDKICDWFHTDSDKSSLIRYGILNDLLKKSLYGHSPTPQYIGKLGFAKPTTRTYSFNDFVLIRNRFIQSRSNQSRPTSFILFEQL